MSLVDDIIENLQGFSKAMYSTWYYYRSSRLLFDAGEGVSTTMANFVFGIEKVFLTHGHYDHIGGLPGLILSRTNARGDTEKDLEIYYPAGDFSIGLMRDYLARLCRKLSYDVIWCEVDLDTPPLELSSGSGNHRLIAFPTQHVDSRLTLGYQIVETRQRLRPAYADLPQAEIGRIAREQGRDGLMETYNKPLLAYTGDCLPLNPDLLRGAEVVLHDATFLNADDRDVPLHATAGEALETAMAAEVGALVLFHLSHRYFYKQAMADLQALLRDRRPDFPVYCVFPSRPGKIQLLEY